MTYIHFYDYNKCANVKQSPGNDLRHTDTLADNQPNITDWTNTVGRIKVR